MISKLELEWLALTAGLPKCGMTDQGLKDVDPFDINLSTEMKLRIWKECRINPRYFFMYVLRAPEEEIREIDQIAIKVMEELKS